MCTGIDGLDITLIDDMDEVFAQSDIISRICRCSTAPAGIITSRQLDRMRPGSMIVNTARAEIIEPGALTPPASTRRRACGHRRVRP